jgi:hypothetical protein
MARRRKSRLSFARIAMFAVVIAAIAAAAWFGYERVNRRTQQAISQKIATPPAATQSDMPRRIDGTLAASGPARDGQLGVSANAAVLLRRVEIYQWREHCAGTTCRYDTAWSAPVDSHKFREPKGHENPPAPFGDSVFVAPGLKIGAYALDPDLLVAQAQASEHVVHGANLPPNLAASFSERDGVLYAGGDPAHPAVGEVRVSYRAIPTGSVSLIGTLRGGKLVSH